ncbi:MAG: hypothetical protein QOH86_1234 [Sphingomonadales bacterium]|nr:hypothetical protein [Sphingomonadales bacterium]
MTDAPRPDPCHAHDKLGLFVLAGMAIAIIGMIAAFCFWKGIPEKADVLLGSIVTGVLLYSRDIVNLIRASWQDQTMSKMGDQLAGSQPGSAPAPPDAKAAADQVAGAAADEADAIAADPIADREAEPRV